MIKFSSALALAALLSGGAMAQGYNSDAGFYAEGGAGYLNIEPEGADEGVDTATIQARFGYRFSERLSLEADLSTGIDEGEFDYNVDEDDFNLDDNADGDFNDIIAASGDVGLNYLLGVYGRASFPLTQNLEAHARLGYAYIDIDADVVTPGGTSIDRVQNSEDGVGLGGGLTYALSERWSLRGDATYYAFDNTDTVGAGVTLGYTF